MSNNNRASEYRRNAQGHFTQSQKRDELLKAEQANVQNAEKEKIARLRAQRLAKESTPDGPGDGNEEN